MRIAFLFFMTIVVLSGCTNIPPIPNYHIGQGDRIGILVDVGEQIFYSRVGISPRMKTKAYPINWEMGQTIVQALTRELGKNGKFEVVPLRKHGFTYAKLA
jgi:hypothetical protein